MTSALATSPTVTPSFAWERRFEAEVRRFARSGAATAEAESNRLTQLPQWIVQELRAVAR